MKNQKLERVADIFVDNWTVSITNQRWLDDPTVTPGVAKGEWLGDAFVQLRIWLEVDSAEIFGPNARARTDDLDQPAMQFVFGRNDARDRFVALYHDERGVARVFDLTLDGDTWTLHRADPDFHQRLIGQVDGDRIVAHPDMSEDDGATWVKDFDMTFERSR